MTLRRRVRSLPATKPPNKEMQMIKIQRLGHVLIAVRDLEVSKRFYMDLLGFKLLEQDPDHGGVFLSIGDYGNTLDLFPSTAPDASPPSASDGKSMPGLGVKHVAFAVESEVNLKAAYDALVAAGVHIVRALDHESQKSVYFHDPDGNLLEIVWERPDALAIFAKGRADNDEQLSFHS
jgi:catechol 2,3-dioxygenase-like lactoylglutathione lyase family enzyme